MADRSTPRAFKDRDALRAYEAVLLLALREETGTVAPGVMVHYVLSGAAVAELLLSKRIDLEGRKNSPRVRVLDPTPLGDPLLDECLGRITASKRPADLRTWVTRLAQLRGLRRRAAERLCQRGILRAEEQRVLFFFPRTVYPLADPRPKRALVERLSRAIFSDEKDVDPDTVVLLSLAHGGRLLPLVFERRKLKEREGRIKSVINGEMTGKATREAIEAMQAAVLAASITPAVIAASAGRSR